MKYTHALQVLALLTFSYACSPKLIPFEEKGVYGYKNAKKQVLINPKYPYAADFHEGFAKVGFNIKRSDSIWYEAQFDGEGYWEIDNYEVSRYSFIDQKGNMFPLELKDAKQFSEGLAPAMLNNKWGYLNKEGQWAIEPQYAVANLFKGGKAEVIRESNNGKTWYYLTIDKQNNVLKDDKNGKRKPDWFDSIPNWRTLIASGHLYIRLTDYESSYLYFEAASRRIDLIEKEDTMAYMDLCQQMAYFGAMRVEDKVYTDFDTRARKKMEDIFASDISRRRMIILKYIDYLIQLSIVRENNLQKDLEKETLELIIETVKRSGTEDIDVYWDIIERLEGFGG